MEKPQNRMETEAHTRNPKGRRWPGVLDIKPTQCRNCGSARLRSYHSSLLSPTVRKQLLECQACGYTHEAHVQIPPVDASNKGAA